VDGSSVGPGLSGDFVAHVGTGIRSGGGALCRQHGSEMSGFMEEITGVEQALGVYDEAAWFERDAGQEGVGSEGREANGEADLLEKADD
jgi:hypothetical protein